ncbi:tyrosine-protein kinase etk [Leminorella grimontii]|uniref:Tyrosine-protein kinase etk n=2 Tax=Leminorella grimontii TaxID=82981 RepID=A0AAV5N005_9GAMM|nr:polysaccharide biosynthesis tyrosine autokinase [Leminorella grimontii]GKX54873.1 tyrosine-protein kinase etk [Leminorella grimontii]
MLIMSTEATTRLEPPFSQEIDLVALIATLAERWIFIFCVTAAFVAGAVLYALMATPVYRADALVQVEQRQDSVILKNLNQMFSDGQVSAAPDIQILQSRMILGQTVDDLNLRYEVRPDYFPLWGKGWAKLMGKRAGTLSVSYLRLPDEQESVLKIDVNAEQKGSYRLRFNGVELEGRVGELVESGGVGINVASIDVQESTVFNVAYLTRQEAIHRLQQQFVVTDRGKDSGMLQLALTGEEPGRIETILNSIMDNYLTQSIARQAARDSKSLSFLQQLLPRVRSELDAAEDKLNQYRQQKDSVDLNLEAQSVLAQTVNIENQLNELTFREAEIAQLYKKNHPAYKSLMEKKLTLEQEKQRLNERVSAMPATQQEVLRLSRDVESGRAIYMQLLKRQQELNIAKSSAIGNVRIIDSALSYPAPIRPKKALVVALGFIMGLVVSAGIVLMRMVLNKGIESPEQLEERGINVYASVPFSDIVKKKEPRRHRWFMRKAKVGNLPPRGLLAATHPLDLSIEAIRGLRTSLHFAMIEARNGVLMISGLTPECGKTFISSNLAASVALAGKKVLYIDADMRKGYAHTLFNVGNGVGLSDVLSGKCVLDAVLQHIEPGGFDFISRGQTPPNPSELLMLGGLESLLRQVGERYDIVIVDTPPVLPVTDSAIIGRFAGTTLLVARFGVNTIKEVEAGIGRLTQSGVEVKGIILNGVIKKKSDYYKYSYSVNAN